MFVDLSVFVLLYNTNFVNKLKLKERGRECFDGLSILLVYDLSGTTSVH